MPTLAREYANWNGDLDIAVGGIVSGSEESYSEAARGAYQARWTAMARSLQRYRGNAQGVTYVRPFHEFNGNWYKNWFVTPENVEDYKTSFRLMAKTIRDNCPSCVMVWSPNNSSSPGAAPMENAYPGDDVVDVISIDSYNANGNTVVTDQHSWRQYANATKGSEPAGVESWRQFAERHGKPLGLSEWGLNPAGGGGDNAAYIQEMNSWISQHASQPGDSNPAGKILYDVYFNVRHEGQDGFLIRGGPNRSAGHAYTNLRWGSPAASQAASPELTELQPRDVVLTPAPSPTIPPPLPATGPVPAIVPIPATAPVSTPVPTPAISRVPTITPARNQPLALATTSPPAVRSAGS